MKRILVTSYVNPDLDGVAGVIAYGELLTKVGKVVDVGLIGHIYTEAKYVLDLFKIAPPQIIEDTANYDEVILVDASEMNVLEGKVPPEKVIEMIDHRQAHEADRFPNAKAQIELVGAAATLVAEKFMNGGLDISRESAILLYCAIVSNTLNFKGTVTTDRDRQASMWLNRTANLPVDFWKNLFAAKSNLSGSKLEEQIIGDFAWFNIGQKKVGIGQIEMVGAEKLIEERRKEILEVLKKIKADLALDFVFLNIVELAEERNYFVSDDVLAKTVLEQIFNIKFSDCVAVKIKMTLRKQIVPLLKKMLE